MGCGHSLGNSRSKAPKIPSIFNYKLKGVWDKDAKANFEATVAYKLQNPGPDTAIKRLEQGRQMMAGFIEQARKMELYSQYPEKCHNESKIIDGTQYGSDNDSIQVLIHRPKQYAKQEKNRPCIVYGHGGGACMMSAKDYDFIVCRTANDNGCIVVNVEYRLAPEAKAPKGINDYYAALKWTVKNAEELGIDPKRICVMGDSGGGYITAGACVKLVQNNEEDLVKLYVPIVPMASNYYFVTKKQDMNEVEKNSYNQMIDCFGYLTDEPQKKLNDPYIFPNQMGDAVAKKFPKTVIFTSQFCFLRQSAEEMANLLWRNGRLLDMCIRPGCDHDFFANFESKNADAYFQDIKKALSRWL